VFYLQYIYMHPSTSNLLYRRPELYELLYPEKNEATPRMCHALFQRYLSKTPSSLLDIGCGTARDLNVLSRHCPDCWGVDYLEANISYAKKIRPQLNLRVGDMRSVRLDRAFEAILCLGSTIMYALDNKDIAATLSTFKVHAQPETLLILDLNNASSFLPGGKCTVQREFEINTPGFSARAVATFSFDRAAQHFIRKRTWFIPNEKPVEDLCRYRMFFPAELRHLLTGRGFDVLGIWDNMELADSDLTNPTLYVAAKYNLRSS
jgi:SAM-dependent methyltransferase